MTAPATLTPEPRLPAAPPRDECEDETSRRVEAFLLIQRLVLRDS